MTRAEQTSSDRCTAPGRDGRFRTSLVVDIGHPGDDPWFDRLPRLDAEEVVTWT